LGGEFGCDDVVVDHSLGKSRVAWAAAVLSAPWPVHLLLININLAITRFASSSFSYYHSGIMVPTTQIKLSELITHRICTPQAGSWC
jgi:hypothetical protein